MDTPFPLLFQVNREGETDEWRANVTVFHKIADLISFYRIQTEDSTSGVTFSVAGNYDISPQSLIGTVLELKYVTPAEEYKSKIVLHVRSPSFYEHQLESPVQLNVFRLDGSITQHSAQLSDSIHHLKKDICDPADEVQVQVIHTGETIQDEALTIGEILKLDVPPLFKLDLKLVTDQSSAGNNEVALIRFTDYIDLEVLANTGLRMHQVKSILRNVMEEEQAIKLYNGGLEIQDEVSIADAFKNPFPKHTIIVKPASASHIEYIKPSNRSANYTFQLGSAEIALDDSQCFVVDNSGDTPYAVVNTSGISDLHNRFSGNVIQKVKVAYRPRPTATSSPEREQGRRLEEEVQQGAFLEAEAVPIAVDFQAAAAAVAVAAAAERPQDLLQFMILTAMGTVGFFYYLGVDYAGLFLQAFAIFHIPMLFFGDSLAGVIEHANEIVFRRNRLAYFHFLSRAYCYVIRGLNRISNVPINAIIRLCVKGRYDYEVLFEEAERNYHPQNTSVLRVIVGGGRDIAKDTALFVISLLPSKVTQIEIEVEAWRRNELKRMFEDIAAYNTKLSATTVWYDSQFGATAELQANLQTFSDTLSAILEEYVNQETSDDDEQSFCKGVEYFRRAVSYRNRLLECISTGMPATEEVLSLSSPRFPR